MAAVLVKNLDTGDVFPLREVYKFIDTGVDPSILDSEEQTREDGEIFAEGAADVEDETDAAAFLIKNLDTGERFPLYEIHDRIPHGVDPGIMHYDLILECFDKQYRVHKNELVKSPYFKAMLSGPWMEASAKRLRLTFEDPNITEEAVELAIDYLYDENIDVTIDDQFQLLATACMFQVNGLINKAVRCIIDTLCVDTFIDAAEFALHYSQDELLSECLCWLKRNIVQPGITGLLQRKPITRRMSLARTYAGGHSLLLLDGNQIRYQDRSLSMSVFYPIVQHEASRISDHEVPLPPPEEGGPSRELVQCYIKRRRQGTDPKSCTTYSLYLADGQRFLLAAQLRSMDKKGSGKKRSAEYIISSSPDEVSMHNKHYLGTLKCNFLGTQSILYDKGINPDEIDASLFPTAAIRKELCSIHYEVNLFGGGPRRLKVVVQDNEEVPAEGLVPCSSSSKAPKRRSRRSSSGSLGGGRMTFVNKPPQWNDRLNAYCLNFNGRVKMASKKNFQLMAPEQPQTVVLQFGKVDKETFVLDYRHPLSCVQAFAIAMSSYGKKMLVI